jgi:hypothetical protein
MFIEANEENYVIEIISIYIQKPIILTDFREILLLSQHYKHNWRR